MDELIKYQQSVIETVDRENEKADELKSELNLEEEIKLAGVYRGKLDQICRDIALVREKSERIKQRAIKLQERKQREQIKAELNRDKQKQMDNNLVPVVLAKNKAKKKEPVKDPAKDAPKDVAKSKATEEATCSKREDKSN